MTDLRVRVELTKLAHELGVDVSEVDFLGSLTAREIAELRDLVSQALFAAQEHRFGRLAAVVRLVPPAVGAKVAQAALTPMMAARVSAVIDPPLAVRVATHLQPDFLVGVTAHLDPARSSAIVTGLPEELLIEVGRGLFAQHEYIALGRFISVLRPETSLAVVEAATPLDAFRVALYTDDHDALDAVVAGLSDERLAEILAAADSHGELADAVELFSELSPEVSTRVQEVAPEVTPGAGSGGRTA